MRKAVFCILAFLALFIASQASAEIALVMDTPSVSLGQTVLFHTEGGGGELRYEVYRGGELLFRSAFTDQSSGAYIPKGAGTYMLKVTDRSSGKSAQQTFSVTGALRAAISGGEKNLVAGEAAEYTASAEGGAPPYTYTFSVNEGSERIYGRSGPESSFSYTASVAGSFTVVCTVTDSQNASASAQTALNVKDGPGISAESEEAGPFRLYGGVRSYTVHSPGVWTAETDADFISLSTNCGGDGSRLTVTVLPGADEARRGTVTLRCGHSFMDIVITRLTDDGIEREISLKGGTGEVRVDGKNMAVWENASGEKEFSVVSDSDWIASASADWIGVDYTPDGNLLLKADKDGAASRAGFVLIENDSGATAFVSVYQIAESDAPDVESVNLSATMGISYQDRITAALRVRGEADRVIVYRISGNDPVAVSGADNRKDDGTWLVTFPLEGSGEESYLFAAERNGESGRMMIASVNAFSEQAIFNDLYADAEIDGDICTICAQLSSSVVSILMLDADGRETGMITSSEASVDRYIDENNHGRFSQWTFTVPSDSIPAMLRIANQTLDVAVREKEYPNLVFSQFDGTWSAVRYRHSNLETSGCAVFTLASALRRLGFTSEDALPAALASTYAFCLVDGGTLNSTLVGNAARDFGFRTRYDLYTDRESVESLFAQGAVFSFSIVKGHIALADAISEDGKMIHIVDSAMSSTFARLNGARMYNLNPDGSYTAVGDPSEIPGALFYIETGAFSGGEYWMESDYVIRRGVRLLMNRE